MEELRTDFYPYNRVLICSKCGREGWCHVVGTKSICEECDGFNQQGDCAGCGEWSARCKKSGDGKYRCARCY